MTELIKVNHSNPLEECGEVIDVSVEDEIKPLDDDEDASYNTMLVPLSNKNSKHYFMKHKKCPAISIKVF